MAKNEVYNTLPGFEVPVGKALSELSNMWEAPSTGESRAPSEFRASRMNLVLHMGFECSVKDAHDTFQVALDFSRRYPCRVVILCAQPDSWDAKSPMVCKIYSQCDIGTSGTAMSCCEVLTLGYSLSDRQYLENQVSIFLETDLPTYYWPVRFGSAQRLSDYKFFFKESRRIIFDTSCDGISPDEVDIEEQCKVYDMAFARLLSIRQSIGQFVSSYPIETVLHGLTAIKIVAPPCFVAEGKALMGWMRDIIGSCDLKSELKFEQIVDEGVDEPVLSFEYDNDNSLTCELDREAGLARIKAVFDGDEHSMNAGIRLLNATEALAESMFHG